MTDTDRTEVTSTGIVRKRNENGYIIHPDRHDTGKFDRRVGWSFISGGVLTSVAGLPAYGFRGAVATALLFVLFGAGYVRSGRQKRRHVGGYRGKRRSRDTNDNESTLLDSDPIWNYRHYWALLGLGSVTATVITGDSLFGRLVPVVTFVAIVILATYGWMRRGGSTGDD